MVSKVLEEVLGRVRTWPEERQDAAARLLLNLEAQDAGGHGLSDEQAAEVERRLANPNRRFLTLEEMREHFTLPLT